MVLLKSTPPRSKLSLHYTETYFKKVAFGYVLPGATLFASPTASQNLCAYHAEEGLFLPEAFL